MYPSFPDIEGFLMNHNHRSSKDSGIMCNMHIGG